MLADCQPTWGLESPWEGEALYSGSPGQEAQLQAEGVADREPRGPRSVSAVRRHSDWPGRFLSAQVVTVLLLVELLGSRAVFSSEW